MGVRNPRMVAASEYAKAVNRLDTLREQKRKATERASELEIACADQEKIVRDAEAALKAASLPAAASTP